MSRLIIAPDGKEMILIPGGSFSMGSEEFETEKPAQIVTLEAYYIDKYPVTNEEYQRFVDATGHKAPKHWPGGNYPSGQADFPVDLVNWHDAQAYCASVGKRLPTEAEWEKAARGTDGRRWPWGNEFRDELAATWETSVLCMTQTTSVLAHPGGASPYGVCEMGGQVEEWVADWFDAHPGSTYAGQSFGRHYRVLKGGSWIFMQTHARCAYRCFERPDADFDPLLGGPGFRCALDVQKAGGEA